MTPCPTDDVLGAHVERALAATDAAIVTSHLDSCPTCRAIVVAAVKARAIGTPARGRRAPRGTLPPAAAVGRYTIRGLLGAGGMGEVYEAYDGELERAVALKVMRPELVGKPGVLAERLVRESRMMAKLAHPSVIAVHDVGRVDEIVFIAMELIRGETLGAYVRRVRPPWRELVALLERAGQGLAAAHAAGIVHRDFKPENVLVELSGAAVTRVVVTDFGVARTASEEDGAGVRADARSRSTPEAESIDVRLTQTGTTVGTPAYMAPEQLAGGTLDARADVFAFAVSAWELAIGERPYPGKTVAELRAGMLQPPRGPRSRIPARLVRVLERGLAIRADARHPSMDAFVRALAATRRRTRAVVTVATLAGIAALAGAGLAGSRVVAEDTVDPCARGSAELAAAYDRTALFHALAGDRLASAKTLAELDEAAAAWRATHAATCRPDAEPPQPASTAACLDARRAEIAGVVDDLVLDGPAHATRLVALVGEPAACAQPAPSLVLASVPADPALRRSVTALRYRAFAAEAARDRGDYKQALAAATAISGEAKLVWPRLHAETLYLLGTTQTQGGDNTQGLATLRETAAVAERANCDYIAANAWIALVQSTAFDAGEVTRALDYLAHADAAVDRLGDKPNVKVMLEYVRGSTLSQAHRNDEAEVALREALALAEQRAPELLPMVIQGYGYVLEGHGRYDEAAAMYRKALAELAKRDGNPSNEATFRERLAQSLTMIGETAEAEVEARRAVAISDRILGDTNLDRAIAHAALAQVLQAAGKPEAALVEAEIGLAGITRISGERSERHAEGLVLVATILLDLDRPREADAKLARACEIHAFALGDNSATLAECYMQRAIARSTLGKNREALGFADKALAIFRATFAGDHPQVATAHVTRGALHAELGEHAAAIEDLERAVAAFTKQPRALDVGHLAAAEWVLGRELYIVGQRVRGRALVDQAVARFAEAAGAWQEARSEATDWLRVHRQ